MRTARVDVTHAAAGCRLAARHYPGRPGDSSAAPASDLRPERDASGRADTHTWSSLLLDEMDDERACAQVALGPSLGQADELRAPWVLLARSRDRWCVYKHADRAAVCDELGSIEVPRAKRATWTRLLPRTAADVLHRLSADVVLRKTWGDSVHAVFIEPVAPCHSCAMDDGGVVLSAVARGGRQATSTGTLLAG